MVRSRSASINSASRNHAGYLVPPAPSSIEKGSSLKLLLGKEAIAILAKNMKLAYPDFQREAFERIALRRVQPFELMERGRILGSLLQEYLPESYEEAVSIILKTLTPPLERTEKNGLAGFFYLPHTSFVAQFGIDAKWNNNKDPFHISLTALSELTRRFTSEFAIRPFLIADQARVLKKLHRWTKSECPHIRRLCTEGTRPRLPWGVRLPSFVHDPTPTIPILEALKDDPVLYVRRSVANHLGDIAKDHPKIVFSLCRDWLADASPERKWVIRHALRYLAKKGDREALRIRKQAVC